MWLEHNIAGSDQPARLVMLHADAERETRTVLVQFPPGWKRDAVGHQPAGEEMVILDGALSISGVTAGLGDYLVVEPRATRSATSVADGTRALVWFSGPGGGWTDGSAADPGQAAKVSSAGGGGAAPCPPRAGRQRSPCTTSWAETVFDADVEVLWTAARHWAPRPRRHAGPGPPRPVRSCTTSADTTCSTTTNAPPRSSGGAFVVRRVSSAGERRRASSSYRRWICFRTRGR